MVCICVVIVPSSSTLTLHDISYIAFRNVILYSFNTGDHFHIFTTGFGFWNTADLRHTITLSYIWLIFTHLYCYIHWLYIAVFWLFISKGLFDSIIIPQIVHEWFTINCVSFDDYLKRHECYINWCYFCIV